MKAIKVRSVGTRAPCPLRAHPLPAPHVSPRVTPSLQELCLPGFIVGGHNWVCHWLSLLELSPLEGGVG